jgi:hypothetical protein
MIHFHFYFVFTYIYSKILHNMNKKDLDDDIIFKFEAIADFEAPKIQILKESPLIDLPPIMEYPYTSATSTRLIHRAKPVSFQWVVEPDKCSSR